MGPSRIRSVVAAMAERATHGSPIGSVQDASTSMWSQRKNPSQPASSVSRASVTRIRGSAKSPKLGTLIPYCTGQ